MSRRAKTAKCIESLSVAASPASHEMTNARTPSNYQFNELDEEFNYHVRDF